MAVASSGESRNEYALVIVASSPFPLPLVALPLVRHILLWKMESLLAGKIYDNVQGLCLGCLMGK